MSTEHTPATITEAIAEIRGQLEHALDRLNDADAAAASARGPGEIEAINITLDEIADALVEAKRRNRRLQNRLTVLEREAREKAAGTTTTSDSTGATRA